MKKYFEHGWQYYKIVSEKSFVAVFDCAYHKKGIEINTDCPGIVDYVTSTGKPITAEQYQEKFNAALNHINHAAFMETFNVFERNQNLQDSLNSIV